ncbi:hypothetical protein VCR26J2_350520 [Vibrio coralliirubri]|nr:hypothetical protein VCR26J2_350520 [Vibrio coralliirubri]
MRSALVFLRYQQTQALFEPSIKQGFALSACHVYPNITFSHAMPRL